MSPVGGPSRSTASKLGEALLWTTAGLSVFLAHAGALAMLLREPPMEAADDSPPAAIMIEMAAEPVAEQVEEEQIAPDEVEAEEVQTAAAEPLPEPVMELPKEPPVIPPPEVTPEPEPEPVTESIPDPEPPPPEPLPEPPPPEEVVEEEPLPEPEEIEPVEETVASLENVEVPLPISRPPPPPEKKEPEKKVEKKKEPPKKVAKKPTPPPAASKAQMQAKAQVQQSNRTAAAQSASGSGSSMSPARWQNRVRQHILRRVKKPGQIQQRVVVTVTFTFDRSGNVLSVRARNSSGNPALDEAAVSIIRRSSPLPAPPPDVPTSLTVPVEFK